MRGHYGTLWQTSIQSRNKYGLCPYSCMRITYTLPARRPMEVMPDAASFSNPRSSFAATVCESPVSSM